MQLKSFKDQKQYEKSQLRANRKKSSRTSVSPLEVRKIVDYLLEQRSNVRGLCHGVKEGRELILFEEEFKQRFANADVVGTDLFEQSNLKVVVHDFHKVRSKWLGAFDFVYTNAMDHAHDPFECVRVWLDQLNENGLLFVQWSFSHIELNRGDCFGATLYEYICLLNKIGEVIDLLYVGTGTEYRGRKEMKIIIVATKKKKESSVG